MQPARRASAGVDTCWMMGNDVVLRLRLNYVMQTSATMAHGVSAMSRTWRHPRCHFLRLKNKNAWLRLSKASRQKRHENCRSRLTSVRVCVTAVASGRESPSGHFMFVSAALCLTNKDNTAASHPSISHDSHHHTCTLFVYGWHVDMHVSTHLIRLPRLHTTVTWSVTHFGVESLELYYIMYGATVSREFSVCTRAPCL